MVDQSDRVVNRFAELSGKPHKKIPKSLLRKEQIVAELDESVKNLRAEKPKSDLNRQKLEGQRIRHTQELNNQRTKLGLPTKKL